MDPFELVIPQCCSNDLAGGTAEEVLRNLITLADDAGKLKGLGKQTLVSALLERERQGSTGFGGGLALPHARIAGLDDFVICIGVSKKGVAFQALDKKPVRLFIMVLAPEDRVQDHLKLLAAISRTLAGTKVKQQLLNAASPLAVNEAFLAHCRSTAPKAPKRRSKLLCVVLFAEELLHEILESFVEHGVEGATILDSQGMGHYISNIPIFADFIGFMRAQTHQSKTILALVPEDLIPTVLAGVEEITGDLDKRQGAVIMVLDVSFYRGSMAMM